MEPDDRIEGEISKDELKRRAGAAGYGGGGGYGGKKPDADKDSKRPGYGGGGYGGRPGGGPGDAKRPGYGGGGYGGRPAKPKTELPEDPKK